MKHIKLFTQFINESVLNIKTVYHASPYHFKSFKKTDTFFSETKKFAIEYSETKSIDQGIDNETNLYICELKGDIFDINNESEFEKLKNILPEDGKYVYNDKEEFLLNLKGFVTNHVYEPIKDIKIGETFPNPEYEPEKFVVLDKDDKYVYYITDSTYSSYIESGLRGNWDKYFSPRISSDKWVIEIFKEMNKYVYEYVDKHIQDNKEKYPYVSEYYRQEIMQNLLNSDKEFNKKYKDLFSENCNKVIEHIKKTNYLRKINIDEEIVELEDTWRLYENVIVLDSIKNLGYDGYVAKEKGIKTYNIFYPDKCVKIKEFQLPVDYSFDSYEDYEDYENFYKENHGNFQERWHLYDEYKKKKDSL